MEPLERFHVYFQIQLLTSDSVVDNCLGWHRSPILESRTALHNTPVQHSYTKPLHNTPTQNPYTQHSFKTPLHNTPTQHSYTKPLHNTPTQHPYTTSFKTPYTTSLNNIPSQHPYTTLLQNTPTTCLTHRHYNNKPNTSSSSIIRSTQHIQ